MNRVNNDLRCYLIDILLFSLNLKREPEGAPMSESRELIVLKTPSPPSHRKSAAPPSIVTQAGPAACFAWDEFFSATIRNAHTRTAYRRAVRQFLNWLEPGIALTDITPAIVGEYFNQHKRGPSNKKLHLAALRALFDRLVLRHAMILNPACSVRGERYQVIEGKTPEITIEQARRLINSIKTHVTTGKDTPVKVPRVVGLRDRAIIAVMIFTAARAGAIAKLRLKHFAYDGSQWAVRFEEKGGKSREIPVRHDLQGFILEYITTAALDKAPPDSPLFPSAVRKTGRLTSKPVTGVDMCRMVKRRLKDAGLPVRLSPHSFRVFTVTDLLTQGVPLEDVQYLAGHADPRTTRLYDRRQKKSPATPSNASPSASAMMRPVLACDSEASRNSQSSHGPGPRACRAAGRLSRPRPRHAARQACGHRSP
jgi:integrase/recombinase XerD